MLRYTIYILRTLAVLSVIYYISVLVVSGIHTSFVHFWLVVFFGCLILSFILSHLIKADTSTTKHLATLLCGLFWMFMFFFLFVEGVLIYKANQSPKQNADYAIVLGAQVRGSIPSKTLNMRIKAAYRYLIENPDTIVICSGGKGDGEHISEASAIKQGLIELGIEESRILLEDASTNTVENLKNSMKIIGDNNKSVVIITSNFHCYRAVELAKKIGYLDVSSFNANEFMVTTLQYYVREFFALGKDYLFGNI